MKNLLFKEIKNPGYLILILGFLVRALAFIGCGGDEVLEQMKEPSPVIYVPSCNNLKKSRSKALTEIGTYKKCTTCDTSEQCGRIVVFVSKCRDYNEEAFAEVDILAKSLFTRIYKPEVQSFGVLRVLGEERCRVGEESLCSGWTITGKYCQ